jgi:predicted RNA methylase
VSAYDPIARLYDPWSASVIEDISFYIDEAVASGGPVVELGVGTGRIAIPTAMSGIRVIGVDSSEGMLAVCAQRAREAGVDALLDRRVGDFRRPPVTERVPLVTCPFRAYLHLSSDEERVEAFRAARALLTADGRLVFDVFAPSREDIEETHGRWIEREPQILERADWDVVVAAPRTVARAARRGRVRRRGLLRLVRPPSPHRRRGHGLDRPPAVMAANCDKIVSRTPLNRDRGSRKFPLAASTERE